MNREARRRDEKNKNAQRPTKLLVGCVGAAPTATGAPVTKHCGTAVLIPYEAFKHPKVLMAALQAEGWALSMSSAQDQPDELVNALLCPECQRVVLGGRTLAEAITEVDKNEA